MKNINGVQNHIYYLQCNIIVATKTSHATLMQHTPHILLLACFFEKKYHNYSYLYLFLQLYKPLIPVPPCYISFIYLNLIFLNLYSKSSSYKTLIHTFYIK